MIHDSHFWQNHFKYNLTVQRVDWSVKPSITETKKADIIDSLEAWQLDETSDGMHLLAAAITLSWSRKALERV